MQAPSPGRPPQAPHAPQALRAPPTPVMQLVARGFVLSDAEKELERQGGSVERAAEALAAKLRRSIERDRSTLELLQSEGTAEEHLASLRTGLEQLVSQLDTVEARRPADAGPPDAGDDVQERLQRAQTTISHLTQTNLLLQQEPGAELMVEENLQQIAHFEAEIARLTPTPRREAPSDNLGAPPAGVGRYLAQHEAELEPEPEPEDGTPIVEPELREEIAEVLDNRVERPVWEWEKEWLG